MKQLYQATITVMLYAESEDAAKEIFNEVKFDLHDEISDADIFEANSVPSNWYDCIPYGADPESGLTCGEIINRQRENS